MNEITSSCPHFNAAHRLFRLPVTSDGWCTHFSDSLPQPVHWLTQPHNSHLLWDLVPHILWSRESQSSLIFQSRLVGHGVGGNARSR
jgi:hypothetical protein